MVLIVFLLSSRGEESFPVPDYIHFGQRDNLEILLRDSLSYQLSPEKITEASFHMFEELKKDLKDCEKDLHHLNEMTSLQADLGIHPIGRHQCFLSLAKRLKRRE